MNPAVRLTRERNTVHIMIEIFCQAHHGKNNSLCPECQALQDYADARLDRCPFQENKPTCANCPVHCYKPEMRARVKQVMRFAGPRMIWSHPGLAILHLLDGRRKVEPIKKR